MLSPALALAAPAIHLSASVRKKDVQGLPPASCSAAIALELYAPVPAARTALPRPSWSRSFSRRR